MIFIFFIFLSSSAMSENDLCDSLLVFWTLSLSALVTTKSDAGNRFSPSGSKSRRLMDSVQYISTLSNGLYLY